MAINRQSRQQQVGPLLRVLLRLLPGRFHAVPYAMGLAGGRDPAALAWLRGFIAEMTRSGFIAQSMARHGVRLASVVMPD